MKQLLIIFAFLLFFAGPVNAKEFNESEERVLAAYLAYYGRPADPGGLEYWSNRLVREGGNINSIIDAFGESEEYQSRFGDLTENQLVTNLYQQLFGRDPDPDGLAFYVGKLNSNDMSLQAISMSILDGVQGDDIIIVNNRLEFSKAYVEETAAGGEVLSSDELAEHIKSIDESPETLIKAVTAYSSGTTDSGTTDSGTTDSGTTEVKSTDGSGGTGEESETTTEEDKVPPVLSLPNNITADSGESGGAIVSFTVSAKDNLDGTVAISCSANSGTTFSIGETVVSCEAADKSGNVSKGDFTVSVLDGSAPIITTSADLTVNTQDAAGIVVNYGATASDNVDSSVAVVCAPLSGTLFEVGETTVNCEASDSQGNVANASFLITVVNDSVVQPVLASVNLSWSIPTSRENGDPLLVGDLSGYEIYIIGENTGNDQVVTVSNPLATSKVIEKLVSDTYHFSISSIDVSGLKSEPSDLITTVISN